MKFKLNAEILATYVNLVSKVVSSKANLPILSNILIEIEKNAVVFSGTDLEVQITAKTPVAPLSDGVTTVNAKLFSQYINTLPKEESVEISVDKNVLNVSSQSGAASFATKESEDFPRFEQEESEVLFDIDRNTLLTMIDKTIFAAAKEDIRPILTGVNIEADGEFVTMVALDTFRMSKLSVNVGQTFATRKQFVVNAYALDNLSRILRDAFINSTIDKDIVTFKMAKAGNIIIMQYGDISVSARVIEGEYPEYKAIIPAAYQTQVTLDKQKLLEAIKRVGVFAQSAINQRIVIKFEKEHMTLESIVPELGSVAESIPASIEGDGLTIAFQLKFLGDAISHIDDDAIVFRAINKNSAGVFIQPSLETFVHLMMPLKLDD